MLAGALYAAAAGFTALGAAFICLSRRRTTHTLKTKRRRQHQRLRDSDPSLGSEELCAPSGRSKRSSRKVDWPEEDEILGDDPEDEPDPYAGVGRPDCRPTPRTEETDLGKVSGEPPATSPIEQWALDVEVKKEKTGGRPDLMKDWD